MRDELLNETLFLSLAHARVEIAAWVEDYNRERPRSTAMHYQLPESLSGYPLPAIRQKARTMNIPVFTALVLTTSATAPDDVVANSRMGIAVTSECRFSTHFKSGAVLKLTLSEPPNQEQNSKYVSISISNLDLGSPSSATIENEIRTLILSRTNKSELISSSLSDGILTLKLDYSKLLHMDIERLIIFNDLFVIADLNWSSFSEIVADFDVCISS